MSMNEHAEQAVKRLRNGTINEVTRASVEATLALAYEQRTATLVSLLVASETAVRIAGVDYSELADTIKERLWLA